MTPLPFDNSYARLPDRFYVRQNPVPVRAPALVALNRPLAAHLGLDAGRLAGAEGLAWLSGNGTPPGSEPLAMAYAGHQFGGWSPQLGDGRALLLGEVVDSAGQRWDIQLKGSGRTPFSRGGDGRAWLGPVLREYLVSEAMAALGVPTTRALAAVTTGEEVAREALLPGAILTRVASSHIRVGTFQYFAARQDLEALHTLVAHVLGRHYPALSTSDAPALTLLRAVTQAQATLVAQWMGLGFIHGVMNTDNCHVGGITIDYGPCAFLDAYDPAKVFSSIDSYGRYAYQNQPHIAQWNLAQLATSLLAVIDEDRDQALAQAKEVIDAYPALYARAWRQVFGAKLGLDPDAPDTIDLAADLLDGMAAAQADFTQTFRHLAEEGVPPAGLNLDDWAKRWRAARDPGQDLTRLCPAVIPRNHRVEEVIAAAVAGDFAPFEAAFAAWTAPYMAAQDSPYRAAPLAREEVRATFCGT